MKVAQTLLSKSEYDLLAEYARKKGATIKDVLREAVRSFVLSDEVTPEDPLFTEPPSATKTGRKERTSTQHDRILYRSRR